MAVKSLDIHPSALAELKSAISWYLEQNETTANKFVTEVDRAIDMVEASPRRWPAGDLDTRKFVLQRFPYAVIYHERESVVRVLAIAPRTSAAWILERSDLTVVCALPLSKVAQ